MECLEEIEWIILYCEPPKILDENNECVLGISAEKWEEVLRNTTTLYWRLIYLENMDEGKFGKVLSKKIAGENSTDVFAAIGRTAEDECKLFKLKTCFQEVGERNWHDLNYEDGSLNLISVVKISTPQLISIIFLLFLLVFYLTIEELRKTVHGQCWINFLVNSLINYSAAIFQLYYIRMEEKSSIYLKYYVRDTKRIENIDSFAFKVSSTFVIYTEFSSYFLDKHYYL